MVSIKNRKSLLLDEKKILTNYNKLSNVIRILILKYYPKILEKYQNENDTFFMNPLIFAFFNKENKEKNKEMLKSILDGTFIKRKPLKNNIYYLQEKHEMLNPYFYEMYRGAITNPKPGFNIDNSKVNKAKKALNIIEEHLPNIYKEISLSNRLIIFHNNNKIINFVTKRFQGFLSFWVVPEVTELYFIEEFIHQGSHNYFNLYLHNKDVFFKGDPTEIQMSEITNNKKDYRSFMSAFHGLYSICKRIEGFKILLEKGIFQNELKHELMGRYVDELIRYRHLGVYKVNLSELLTDEGYKLFEMMRTTCQEHYEEDKYLLNYFNMDFRDIDFYYSEFTAQNPIEILSKIPKN